MFKKIISQLSLSPATIERLGKYAQKNRRNQEIMGLAAIIMWVFVILILIVISFPPSQTSSQVANDLIPGGVSSPEAVLSAYDNNVGGFQDVANLLNIQGSQLKNLEPCSHSGNLRYTTGKNPYYGDDKEQVYQLSGDNFVYIRSSDSLLGSEFWCSSLTDQFAINASDGNLHTSFLPSQSPLTSALSKSHSVIYFENSKTFTWDLLIENPSDSNIIENIYLSTGDISEYATITSVSLGGMTSNSEDYIIWPNFEVPPNQPTTLTVTASLNSPVDETPRQAHNKHSYDCQITTVFGNSTSTSIPCPIVKKIESFSHSLPLSGNGLTLALFIALAITTSALYFCLRLQTKELRIIRTQLNTGDFS